MYTRFQLNTTTKSKPLSCIRHATWLLPFTNASLSTIYSASSLCLHPCLCHRRHVTPRLPLFHNTSRSSLWLRFPSLSHFVTVIPCMLLFSFCLSRSSRSSLNLSHPYIFRSIQNDSNLIEFSLFVAVSHRLDVTTHFPLWHSEPQSSRDTRLPAASRRDQKKTFIIINYGFAQFQTTECGYVCVNVCMQVCLNL